MRRLKLDAPPAPALTEGDARVAALRAASTEPETSGDYVAQITRLWGRAGEAFLEIGKLLVRAKQTLPHGEYASAVEGRLPFTSRTAYQLREAARWALEMDRSKAVPFERLPGSYSTIYLLSTLDTPTLKAAEEEGLLNPGLKRAELVAWKRQRTAGAEPVETLHARRQKLQRERARIDAELAQLEAELELAKL